MKLWPIVVALVCLSACGSRNEEALLKGEGSMLWSLDSMQGGSKNNWYVKFAKDGTYRDYSLLVDDSLHPIDYDDVVHSMTWEFKGDQFRFHDHDFVVEEMKAGKMILRLKDMRFFFSTGAQPPFATAEFDFEAYRKGAFRDTL